jgi:hypothetical protein
MIQDVFTSGAVFERDVAVFYCFAESFQRQCPGIFFYSRLDIKNGKDPFARYHSPADRCICLGNGLRRLEHTPVKPYVNDKRRPAHTQLTFILQPSSVKKDSGSNPDSQEFT